MLITRIHSLRKWYLPLVAVLLSIWPGIINRKAAMAANLAQPTYHRFYLWNAFYDRHLLRTNEARLRTMVSEEDAEILLGSPGLPPANRWKPLWDAHPDDPVFYNRHAFAVLAHTGRLPADYVAIGEKMDPGNGWYRFLATMVAHPSRSDGGESAPALAELADAIAMPRFNSYRDAFMGRQVKALPETHDQVELILNRLPLEQSANEIFRIMPYPSHLVARPDNGRPENPSERVMMKTLALKLMQDSRTWAAQWYLAQGIAELAYGYAYLTPGEDDAEFERENELVKRLENLTKARRDMVPAVVCDRSMIDPPTGDPAAARSVLEGLALRMGLAVLVTALAGCAAVRIFTFRKSKPSSGGRLEFRDRVIILTGALGVPVLLYVLVTRLGFRTLPYGIVLIDVWHAAAVLLAVAIVLLSLRLTRRQLARKEAPIRAVVADVMMITLPVACLTFIAMIQLSHLEDLHHTAKEVPKAAQAGNASAREARDAADYQQQALDIIGKM